jgi:hypothetical protein
MTAIQVKQKAAEEQRVVDKKEGKRVAEEDALSIHSVDQAISQSDLANGRKIPWTSQLRSIAQKYSGVTLIPPLSVPEFIHLTTQTASLE